MTSNWETVKAEDFCYTVTDGTHDSPKAKENGHYLITSKHLTSYSIDFSSAKKISEEDYQKVIMRSPVEQWDILFSMIGTIGITYLEKNTDIDYACKNMGIFKSNGDKDKAYWLYYYLQTPQAKEYILGHLRGTTQQYLPLGSLRDFPIQVPSAEIRNNITSILRNLDDRIAINTAINENLEQQAYFLLENILSTPHDNMCCLSDIANINPRYTLSKGIKARYIDMSQLSTTTSFPNDWAFRGYNGGIKFRNKDTIMARITPCLENGKTAYIDFLANDEIAFGSTEYIVLSPKNNTPPELLYCIVRYPEFRNYATVNMNGSSGRQRVSGEIIGKYELPLFTQEELAHFHSVVEPLFNQITENSLQNRNLSALRDTLLPKLMNGEIDVSAVRI